MAEIELVSKIKQAVEEWRSRNYEGATPVTKRLLEFWFKEQHLLTDFAGFGFWRCQREAVEALVYVYEICKYHSLYDLSRGLEVGVSVDPTRDLWPKYCFKMATGSGKTWVMALAMVWQYFNKMMQTDGGLRYSSHFLLLAPNIIVLDRLKEDFQDKRIYGKYPFVPPEWNADFDLQIVLQSEVISRTAPGILHLTNIQQLYERGGEEAVNPLEAVLGPKPKREEEAMYDSLKTTLSGYDDLMVLNDEGHHVHSDDLEWNKIIADLDRDLKDSNGAGLVMQLDFTATPKDLGGHLFSHIVYDYPLAEAIKDKIVKRPRIGILENIPESTRKDFVARNRPQIDAGLNLLREFKTQLQDTGRKAVLFAMTDNTRNADKVGKYLDSKGYQGKVLVIHTDTKGVITKKSLDVARKAAREIDKLDNPYEIIVSVMMLKEGWDVKNVCVIVPLRAFDSPVLPEQTLGRGLRRMDPQNDTLDEFLIVVDHPRFRQLWQAEIDKGELVADFTSAHRAYERPNLIKVNPEKLQYDIEIPIIEGGLTTTTPDLSKLDMEAVPGNLFQIDSIQIPETRYRERDLLEQKMVREKILAFDYTENFSLYLSYICKAILSKARCSGLFPEVVAKVKGYIQKRLFDKEVDIENRQVVKKLNYIPIREKIVDIFAREISLISRSEVKTSTSKSFKVSETEAFHTSEPVTNVCKSVFDTLPYPTRSEFEKQFMTYLDDKQDVIAFSKVLKPFPLHLSYYKTDEFIAYYEPDFVVRTEKSMYLVETKGIEDINTPKKDERACHWCEDVLKLTGSAMEIPQSPSK